MSKINEQNKEREAAIAVLTETWPEAKWTKKDYTNADLEWLLEIAEILGTLSSKEMAKILAHYRKHYTDSVTPSGRKSKRCGDKLSELLIGMDGTAVIALAEMLLALDEGFLYAKYENLNEGQRRMNASNRLRGGLKREDITIEEIAEAIAA